MLELHATVQNITMEFIIWSYAFVAWLSALKECAKWLCRNARAHTRVCMSCDTW